MPSDCQYDGMDGRTKSIVTNACLFLHNTYVSPDTYARMSLCERMWRLSRTFVSSGVDCRSGIGVTVVTVVTVIFKNI